MSIVTEFKEFAMKGNVLDMAVGVVIGARVRQDRLVARRRRGHADARQGRRRRELQGPGDQPRHRPGRRADPA